MQPADWHDLLTTTMQRQSNSAADPPCAVRCLLLGPTRSRPIAAECDDGRLYIVKTQQSDRLQERALTAEHVVGRLGNLLGDIVPPVTHVRVTVDFIESQVRGRPNGHLILPGTAHGMAWMDDCYNSQSTHRRIQHVALNRDRFALLAVFYGWLNALEFETIYQIAWPHTVYSVDHGLFFAATESHISKVAATRATWCTALVKEAQLTPDDMVGALQILEKAVGVAEVAAVVGSLPPEWRVTQAQKIVLCQFIWTRRLQLLETGAATGACTHHVSNPVNS